MTPESHSDVPLENVLIGLNAASDLIEELKNQVKKLRERTREAIAESLVCETCDAGMDVSLAQALQEGWENIQYTPDLPQANYCGTCKDCLDKEDAEIEARRQQSTVDSTPAAPSTSGRLFD